MIKKSYASIPKKLHLVITGETGNPLSFVVLRDRLALVLGLLLLLFFLLLAGSWWGAIFFKEKRSLALEYAEQSQKSEGLQQHFADTLQKKLGQREAEWRKEASAAAALIKTLQQENHDLTQDFLMEKEALVKHYEEFLVNLHLSTANEITSLMAQLDQERQAKQNLIEQTARRLDERSKMIETMMSRIGVEVKTSKRTRNSGGPFLAADFDESSSRELLKRSDQYIETLQRIPLGFPVQGRVTSGFGTRNDPFNGRPAFHAGIDFKGRVGSKIRATADGVVVKSTYDTGGYGHYVIVRHGNKGYETLYAHLRQRLVSKGDRVQRGDTLGLLGSSGRSTGPHLHYEVRHRGKPVDPQKYLSVANLSFTVPQ
jgi:murein DD-endopeptidase MepM/ murein hydrolase activator NlpD